MIATADEIRRICILKTTRAIQSQLIDSIYINTLHFLFFPWGANVTLSFKKLMQWKKSSRQIYRVYFNAIVDFNLLIVLFYQVRG